MRELLRVALVAVLWLTMMACASVAFQGCCVPLAEAEKDAACRAFCVSALYYEAGRLPNGTSMSQDEIRVRAGVMRHAAEIGVCDCSVVKP